jgi:hypothetical protein
MRIWRALKASGAGIMRDGVYVLPQSPQHREVFEKQAAEVRALLGTAYLVEHRVEKQPDAESFQALFDRSVEYVAWHDQAVALTQRLPALTEARARREQAQLRRELETLSAVDFFPGKQMAKAEQALADIESETTRLFSPDEPRASDATITRREAREFSARRWATRANLWVDRVASAWLIKRFIDHDATFLWLQDIRDCPLDSVGFDFDGATFSHVDNYVTFEVLARSFQIDADSALRRIGEVVHYLDVGGAPVDEAAGLLALLTGARENSPDDDQFLDRASDLLDHLYTAFQQQTER